MDTLLLQVANFIDMFLELESHYCGFQSRVTWNTPEGLRSSRSAFKTITGAQGRASPPWLVGAETGRATLENCMSVYYCAPRRKSAPVHQKTSRRTYIALATSNDRFSINNRTRPYTAVRPCNRILLGNEKEHTAGQITV